MTLANRRAVNGLLFQARSLQRCNLYNAQLSRLTHSALLRAGERPSREFIVNGWESARVGVSRSSRSDSCSFLMRQRERSFLVLLIATRYPSLRSPSEPRQTPAQLHLPVNSTAACPLCRDDKLPCPIDGKTGQAPSHII